MWPPVVSMLIVYPMSSILTHLSIWNHTPTGLGEPAVRDEGDAIIFVTGKEVRMLKAIELTLKVPCDEYIFPTLEEMNERREEEFFSRIEEGMKGDLGLP